MESFQREKLSTLRKTQPGFYDYAQLVDMKQTKCSQFVQSVTEP